MLTHLETAKFKWSWNLIPIVCKSLRKSFKTVALIQNAEGEFTCICLWLYKHTYMFVYSCYNSCYTYIYIFTHKCLFIGSNLYVCMYVCLYMYLFNFVLRDQICQSENIKSLNSDNLINQIRRKFATFFDEAHCYDMTDHIASVRPPSSFPHSVTSFLVRHTLSMVRSCRSFWLNFYFFLFPLCPTYSLSHIPCLTGSFRLYQLIGPGLWDAQY